MRRWTFFVAFLISEASCGTREPDVSPSTGRNEDVKDEEVAELPEPQVPEEVVLDEPLEHPSPGGHIVRAERDAPAVFVRLHDGGVLEVKTGDTWKVCTLNECSGLVGAARDLEDVGGWGKATRLFFSIDAEPAVPWQHVQWLMTIAAEQRYREVELSDGARRLLAVLPVDMAIEYAADYRPPPEIRASVHVVVRKEQPAKWGDAEVVRPTVVHYRCGDEETLDPMRVAAYLEESRKTAEDQKATFLGEVKAGHKVPVAKVLDAMEAFVDAGTTNVDLYGTSIPSKAVRRAARFPYPLKNYDAAD